MTAPGVDDERIVTVDQSNHNPGRFDPLRFRNPIEDPNDPYPITS